MAEESGTEVFQDEVETGGDEDPAERVDAQEGHSQRQRIPRQEVAGPQAQEVNDSPGHLLGDDEGQARGQHPHPRRESPVADDDSEGDELSDQPEPGKDGPEYFQAA